MPQAKGQYVSMRDSFRSLLNDELFTEDRELLLGLERDYLRSSNELVQISEILTGLHEKYYRG